MDVGSQKLQGKRIRIALIRINKFLKINISNFSRERHSKRKNFITRTRKIASDWKEIIIKHPQSM